MTIRVLYIEDNPGDVLLVKKMLSAGTEAFEVFHASTLAKACISLEAEEYDVVLMDLSLPDSFGSSGLAACLAAAPNLPILVLTNRDDTKLAPELTRAGAEDYVTKADLTGAHLRTAIGLSIERNKIKRKMAQATEAMHVFSHQVSHDLRAPLRRIRTLLGFLQDDLGENLGDTGIEYLERVEKHAIQMNSLIESLLDYALSGRSALNIEPVSLYEAFSTVTQVLQPEIDRVDAIFECDRLPTVQGDRVWLTSLLQNLLENALKFSTEQTPLIRILCTTTESECQLTIKDNGIGMEPGDAGHLFKPFTRLDNSRKIAGSGIGLSICKQIVERHQGSIHAASDGPGLGTSIVISLPLAQAADLQAPVLS